MSAIPFSGLNSGAVPGRAQRVTRQPGEALTLDTGPGRPGPDGKWSFGDYGIPQGEGPDSDLTQSVMPEFSYWDPEQTQFFSDLSSELYADLQARAAPGASVVTPEQRDALSRQIGSVFAQARGGANYGAAGMGIAPGSGIVQQERDYAASQAANALGNYQAAISGVDEQARQWALDILGRMRGGEYQRASDAALAQATLATGMPVTAEGPTQQLIDPMLMDEVRRAITDGDRDRLMALAASEPSLMDMLPLFFGLIT